MTGDLELTGADVEVAIERGHTNIDVALGAQAAYGTVREATGIRRQGISVECPLIEPLFFVDVI